MSEAAELAAPPAPVTLGFVEMQDGFVLILGPHRVWLSRDEARAFADLVEEAIGSGYARSARRRP
jgi:hypothetical protein